jgi:Ricin-type beta-trefoil lectin domain
MCSPSQREYSSQFRSDPGMRVNGVQQGGTEMKIQLSVVFLAAWLASTCTVAAQDPTQIDPTFFHKLSTEFRGPGMSLDVFNGGPKDNFTHLQPTADFSGQFWHFVLEHPATATTPHIYKLRSLFRPMCLDIVNGGPDDNKAHLAQCALVSGQEWVATREGGMFRMTTLFRGPSMCLDIVNGGPDNDQAHLTPCGNFTGQKWLLTKTNRPTPEPPPPH